MKKIIKVLGKFLLLLVIVSVGFLVYVSVSGIPSYEANPVSFTLQSTPETIARGGKLVGMLCANCHLNAESGKLIGGRMFDAPAEFGEIYAPNITQDKEYGIGSWSNEDLVRLLRTGIKKDGAYSPPYMAKLPGLADSDLNAIISFLNSENNMVIADPTPDQPSEPSFLTKLLCNVEWKPLPFPENPIALPDENDALALGKYLANNLECFSCHSSDFKTNDFLNPEMSVGYFGGGNKTLNLEGDVILTQNLTPDMETGIGSWSEEEFVRAVRFGLKDGEPALRYPMQPYSRLTDNEVGAIYQYLQSLPAISNDTERSGL